MLAWKERLATLGRVVTFDYDYMASGKRRPDPHSTLVAAHRAALASASREHDTSVVLAGKSMGSRIGCHLALGAHVSACVCMGYPLRGQNGKLRDEVLLALRTPVLFVQGTRDSLCPIDELEAVRKKMVAPNFLHIVEEGDHSLLVTKTWLKRNATSQEAIDATVLEAIRSFVVTFARAHAT